LQEDSTYLRGKFVGQFGKLKVGLTGDYFHQDAGGQALRLVGLAGSGATLGGAFAVETAAELGLDPTVQANLDIARRILQSYVDKPFYDYTTNSSPLADINKGGSVVLNLEYGLTENGGAKLVHGSGGLVLLRAV